MFSNRVRSMAFICLMFYFINKIAGAAKADSRLVHIRKFANEETADIVFNFGNEDVRIADTSGKPVMSGAYESGILHAGGFVVMLT